ncbi:sulfite exporter TauE/SafE family protein [Xanthovirga aplysinae]|uniref:sulfite exporter TauE/SafE family protein n=1 Tax=Xanthovirga aplysinae TaxID=2529853 RepID=UPI0012BD27AE|nr:sulfite exporter TauE/SafE family protein [Xanthovirga aplysinae]MTI31565.1 sulfite exporter TauE/SafE family protein [Xanthovirga aplysinae]
MALWTAFIVGLMGSMHCVGMCAPLAMALPGDRSSRWKFVQSRLFYNLGRIITYSLLGFFIGILGEGISLAIPQQYLSIFAGIIIIFSLILPSSYLQKFKAFLPLYRFTNFLKQKFSLQFKRRGPSTSFFVGLLNGLLPCGMVYVALAGAMAGGNSLFSATYMAVFGMGTLPLMLTISLGGNFLPIALKGSYRKALPLFTFLLGCLFILRGMNLGIPYLSPQLVQDNSFVDFILCH